VKDWQNHSFASPSDLREFALETALQLGKANLSEASEILEVAANYATSSGWEWLGELGLASEKIKMESQLPAKIASRIERILTASKSQQPYSV
jgi:hypothetical protein